MKISVTQDDIDYGIPQSFDCCPVALAIRRNFPGSPVIVSQDVIVIRSTDYSATPEIIRFIDNFDEDCAVEPFEFELLEIES